MKKEDCFGIILLKGCKVSIRESSKPGFCFRIFHPENKSIYSTKGLKGEVLNSAKLPGSLNECVIRSKDISVGKEWMTLIQKSSEKEEELITKEIINGQLPPIDETPSLLLKFEEKIQPRIPEEEKPIISPSDLLPSNPNSIVPKVEIQKSSYEEQNVEQFSSEPNSSSSSSSEPSKIILTDHSLRATIRIDEAPQVEELSSSKERESPTNFGSEAELESLGSTDEDDPYREGWVDLKTSRGWKNYWFITTNGLLLFFENEKVNFVLSIS